MGQAMRRCPSVMAFVAWSFLALGGLGVPALADDDRVNVKELLRSATLSGQVTGQRGNRIEIGGQTYTLANDVRIFDDDGQPRTLHDVRVDSEVRVLLRQGQIVLLIILLPR